MRCSIDDYDDDDDVRSKGPSFDKTFVNIFLASEI